MEITNKDLDKAQEILDEFESIHNLKTIAVPSKIDEIWTMSYDRLKKLSAVECSEYAYILAQYSTYIQQMYNREKSKHDWLENKVLQLAAPKLGEYDKYMKYEIKVNLIARENEAFNTLLKHLNFTKQKMTRLEFIPSSIKVLSDNLNNIQRAKSFNNRVENGR